MFNFTKIYQKEKENSKTSLVKIKNSNITLYILLGFVFLLPIFFIPSNFFNFLYSKSILISLTSLILFILWALARLKDGEFHISSSPILLLGILIPFIYFLSSLFSGSIKTSIIGSGFDLETFTSVSLLFVLMFSTFNILKTKGRVYYFYSTFFISFLILSLFGILRLIFGVDFISFGILTEVSSNILGKWNDLGIFYGLVVILSLFGIEFIKYKKLTKVALFITLFVSLFFVALVNYSLIWKIIGASSTLLISLIILGKKYKNSKILKEKKFPIYTCIVIVLSLIFIFGGDYVNTKIPKYFDVTSTEIRPSIQSTFNIAKNTLTSKHFLLGVGPNRFINQWLLYKPNELNNTYFWNTNFNTGVSFIATSLIDVGFLGFISWILFLTFLFFKGLTSVFLSKNTFDNLLLPLTFFSTLYLWMFSVFYIPSYTIIALTFVFTGVFISLLIQNKDIKFKKISFSENKKSDFVIVSGLILLILISVTGGYIFSKSYIASFYSQKSIINVGEKKDIDEIEKNILKAISFYKNDSYYRFLSELNLIKLQNLLKENKTEENIKIEFQFLLSESIRNAKKAIEIDKTNYLNWMSLGNIYEVVIYFGLPEAYDKAINTYLEAIKLNPKNPFLLFTLGVLDYNQKNYQKAMIILEKAVILRPVYSDAKYFLGLTYYNLGRIDHAILQFEDLVVLNPKNDEVKKVLNNLKKDRNPFYELINSTPSLNLNEGIDSEE